VLVPIMRAGGSSTFESVTRVLQKRLASNVFSFVTMAAGSLVSLPLFFLLCFVPAIFASVQVTGNPYIPPAADACGSPSAACSRALVLSPDRVIVAPAPLQSDTFSHVQQVRYMGSVIPVCVASPKP
jgi:hypothetical protein